MMKIIAITGRKMGFGMAGEFLKRDCKLALCNWEPRQIDLFFAKLNEEPCKIMLLVSDVI